ncbi:MAG: hypothetical protein Q7S70_02240 [bacterium]|nr:hypothetical protein [bacterium]
MSYLADLLKRAEAITQFREPEMPFDPAKHKVAGEMSEELKRLFTLWRKAIDNTNDSLDKVRRSDGKPRQKAMKVFYMADAEADALRASFWLALRLEHDLWGVPCIGVTQGFKVVTEEKRGDLEGPMFGGALVVHVVDLSGRR